MLTKKCPHCNETWGLKLLLLKKSTNVTCPKCQFDFNPKFSSNFIITTISLLVLYVLVKYKVHFTFIILWVVSTVWYIAPVWNSYTRKI